MILSYTAAAGHMKSPSCSRAYAYEKHVQVNPLKSTAYSRYGTHLVQGSCLAGLRIRSDVAIGPRPSNVTVTLFFKPGAFHERI